MQCTTANRYKSETDKVWGEYKAERIALGFTYFGNYTEARQKFQDQLITSYIRSLSLTAPIIKTITFMMGAPGAGKSTQARQIAGARVDADLFKVQLPEFQEFPAHLASGVVHLEATLLAAITQRRLEQLGCAITVDSAAASLRWLDPEIARLRAAGWRLELVRVVTTRKKCHTRCDARGRHVPRFVIDQIYDQVNRTFPLVSVQFDRVSTVLT